MKAAWYEKQGPPDEVLVVGEMPTPTPSSGEVLIRIATSGINPGEVKKRTDAFGIGMPYPRVIPHSDGAGTIAAVGRGVDPARVDEVVLRIGALAPGGVDHVVEVAFDSNVAVDERVLKLDGSIAAYATRSAEPAIPFWPLVFKNVRIDFLGSDDFPAQAKRAAAVGLNAALASGWAGPRVDARYSLDEIAQAHIAVEERRVAGRVLLVLE